MGGRGKVLCKRLLNFGCHKMCGIPILVERAVVCIFYIEHPVVMKLQKVNNNLKSYIRFCLLYGFNSYYTNI